MTIGNGLSLANAAALAGINPQNLLYGSNKSLMDPTTKGVLNSLTSSGLSGSPLTNQRFSLPTNSFSTPALDPFLNLTSNGGLNGILSGSFANTGSLNTNANPVVNNRTVALPQTPISSTITQPPVTQNDGATPALAKQLLQLVKDSLASAVPAAAPVSAEVKTDVPGTVVTTPVVNKPVVTMLESDTEEVAEQPKKPILRADPPAEK